MRQMHFVTMMQFIVHFFRLLNASDRRSHFAPNINIYQLIWNDQTNKTIFFNFFTTTVVNNTISLSLDKYPRLISDNEYSAIDCRLGYQRPALVKLIKIQIQRAPSLTMPLRHDSPCVGFDSCQPTIKSICSIDDQLTAIDIDTRTVTIKELELGICCTVNPVFLQIVAKHVNKNNKLGYRRHPSIPSPA